MIEVGEYESVFVVVDKLECLPLKLSVNNDDVLFAHSPLVIPKNASNSIFVLELFELRVEGRPLELDEDAVPLLQAVEFILPNLQLLGHTRQTLLFAESKQIANVHSFHFFEVSRVDPSVFAVFHLR